MFCLRLLSTGNTCWWTNRGIWFPRLSIWKPIHSLKYWKRHLNNLQLSTKASASREALMLQNLTETACMGLRQTDRSRSLCSCYRNLEGRQMCVQITASDTTPARRLAQEKGLLFLNQPPPSSPTLHCISVSNHQVRDPALPSDRREMAWVEQHASSAK